VDARLAAFCEGALPEAEARAVAAHLARCRRCDERRREVERALELVRALPPARIPEDRAHAIRRALVDSGASGQREERRPRLAALGWAAALLLAAAAAAVAYLQRSPRLRVESSAAALSAFERAAVALQRRAADGTLALDLKDGRPSAVRAWVRERTGLDADLALSRPAEDGSRFEAVGAAVVEVAGARAAAVAYRVDGRPTLLLTARAQDVPGRPRAWTLAGKAVRRAVDPASGVQILAWTSGGQSYALASELPGLGLDGCFVCHTDARRRDLIRGLGRPGASPRE
jgi:anti-sigma factor RsiW